jgi:hypothetical protein
LEHAYREASSGKHAGLPRHSSYLRPICSFLEPAHRSARLASPPRRVINPAAHHPAAAEASMAHLTPVPVPRGIRDAALGSLLRSRLRGSLFPCDLPQALHGCSKPRIASTTGTATAATTSYCREANGDLLRFLPSVHIHPSPDGDRNSRLSRNCLPFRSPLIQPAA